MKISVVIPTYNRQEHILNAIASVENQNTTADGINVIDEIIVVDDGSTDDTKKILKNKNITYIYQENSGVSTARNRGIKAAKNEWIAFLDSDDIWHEEKINTHIQYHQNHPDTYASFSDETWVRNGKEITLKSYQQKENPTFLNSLRLCKIGASTFFCNKKIFEKIGYFDEELEVCEDYDLWLRVLKEFQIFYLDKKLTTKYAGHKNQLSFNTKLIDTFRIKALEKHIHSSYKQEVLVELCYKTQILLKGAIKHQNSELIAFCEDKLSYFKSLT